METAIQVLIGLIALICFLGGANILIKGAGHFLPKETPVQKVLDNLLRFLSGIYFGFGFLMVWSIFHISQIHELIYFFGIIVIFSGIGRLYSLLKVGSAGTYFNIIMAFEILLGISLMVLEYFR